MIALAMALAAAQASDPTADELRAEIAARDAIIADLVERVERLEASLAPRATPAVAETVEAPALLDPERALEMILVERGARLLGPGRVTVTPSLGWAVRHDETVFLAGQAATLAALTEDIRRSDVTLGLSASVGLPGGLQLDAALPYRFAAQRYRLSNGTGLLEEATTSSDGVGDVALGLSGQLADGNGGLPAIVARIGGDLGNARRDASRLALGGGFASLGGSVSVLERLDPLVFVATARYAHGFRKDGIDPGDSYGFGLGTYLAAGPETSLRFAFDYARYQGSRIDALALRTPASSTAILTIGGSVVAGSGRLVDVAASLGLTPESPDFALSLAMPVRF